MKWQERAKQLAEEHWGYTIRVLNYNNHLSQQEINLIEFLYEQALEHGYKHCFKDIKDGIVEVEK